MTPEEIAIVDEIARHQAARWAGATPFDDLYQIAWERALKRYHKFDPSRASFRSYMNMTCKHAVWRGVFDDRLIRIPPGDNFIHQMKTDEAFAAKVNRARGVSLTVDNDDDDNPGSHVLDIGVSPISVEELDAPRLEALATACIMHTNIQNRTYWVCRYRLGMRSKDICEHLGVSRQAVEHRVIRATVSISKYRNIERPVYDCPGLELSHDCGNEAGVTGYCNDCWGEMLRQSGLSNVPNKN